MSGGIATENGRERAKSCRAGIVSPTIYNLHVPPNGLIILSSSWKKYRCAGGARYNKVSQEARDARGDRESLGTSEMAV